MVFPMAPSIVLGLVDYDINGGRGKQLFPARFVHEGNHAPRFVENGFYQFVFQPKLRRFLGARTVIPFRAVERVTGHHYELDDFQIQSVTEGREAMGNALVRLRSNGKLYSGKGVSTDIIGASIRAYVAALNKIVYEER